MKTIGLIAGNGKFPIFSARQAREEGYRIVICAIQGEAMPGLEKLADAFEWVKIGELKKLVRFFKKQHVDKAIMAGKVEKVRIFQENVRPDLDMVKVVIKAGDMKDDSLLAGICDYLDKQGVRMLDSTMLMKNSMPGPGVLGKKKPSKEAMADIRFGYDLAKSIAGLDIGQTVIVKKKAVLAVEAIEGTDHAIRRAGTLGNGKLTVVKVAKPNQDMRFDVPTVGLRTLKELAQAGVQAFAFEAHKTIFLDLDEFVSEANHKRIALYGISTSESESTKHV